MDEKQDTLQQAHTIFPPQLVQEMTPPQEENSPLRNNTQASHTLHSKLRSITHVATKVHAIIHSFVVLTWMRDTIEIV